METTTGAAEKLLREAIGPGDFGMITPVLLEVWGPPGHALLEPLDTPASSSSSSSTASNNNKNNFNARQLGVDLAYDLHTFLQTPNHRNGDQILNDWKRWVDWDMELVMRDTPQQERVRLVGVLLDGRVQVQAVGQEDGVKRTLVSDYFL